MLYARTHAHPGDRIIAQVENELREIFGVGHAAIQVETGDERHPCPLAPDDAV